MLFAIGVFLLFLLPVVFFIYVLTLGTVWLVRDMNKRLKADPADLDEESNTPKTTLASIKEKLKPEVLEHNGEHAKLSDYEQRTWDNIVLELRDEESR